MPNDAVPQAVYADADTPGTVVGVFPFYDRLLVHHDPDRAVRPGLGGEVVPVLVLKRFREGLQLLRLTRVKRWSPATLMRWTPPV